jgi:CheY-like chemotaxis protein
METRTLYVEDVKKAIAVIRREVRNAENALTMMDAQECRNALERVQHAAFDAKDLFQ